MGGQLNNDEFCYKLVDVQRGLFAYILRLLPNVADANDVLQKTNVVLLDKQKEFRAGADFNAWAAGIARFQVLAFRRDANRSRLIFRDQLVDRLADGDVASVGGIGVMFEALELCREKLSEADRELLHCRYAENRSAAEIAADLGRTPHAVSQSLYRIRTTLMECIQRALSSQEGGDA